MSKSLTSVFNDVRKVYFPHWKAGDEWVVRRNHPKLKGVILQGICFPEEKVIVVRLPSKNYEYPVIAHEICHAVTMSKYHDKKWRDRFSKVADQAEHLGHKAFADYIRNEVESCRNELPMRNGAYVEIYHIMEEIVSQHLSASFEQIITWMVDEYGYSLTQLKRYRKLEKCYEKIKKAEAEYARISSLGALNNRTTGNSG
jgi:hypothetical protein